jgi:hypothetical protein
MKEPKRIKLTETPIHKDVKKIAMPSIYKPEWDITGEDNDNTYTLLDLNKDNEDNSENNSESIQ